MKPKNVKIVIYPLMILSLVAVIAISIYSFLDSIGGRMNPPQPTFKMEESISSATVFWGENRLWKLNISERLSVFDTGNERYLKGAVTLVDQSAEAFGDVLLIVIRESLNKDSAEDFLSVLSKFKLKKVYIVSPYDDTMAALKKIEPRFWYGASPRSWVKWSLFSTFGIEKAFTVDADFLFVDREISKLLSPQLNAEIKRRNLPVIRALSEQLEY